MEVSLTHMINTKKYTKTACSNRVVVQYFVIKNFLIFKEYFFNLYQMKALETKKFCNFIENFFNFSLTFIDFK